VIYQTGKLHLVVFGGTAYISILKDRLQDFDGLWKWLVYSYNCCSWNVGPTNERFSITAQLTDPSRILSCYKDDETPKGDMVSFLTIISTVPFSLFWCNA